jgi:hypothetical protein
VWHSLSAHVCGVSATCHLTGRHHVDGGTRVQMCQHQDRWVAGGIVVGLALGCGANGSMPLAADLGSFVAGGSAVGRR